MHSSGVKLREGQSQLPLLLLMLLLPLLSIPLLLLPQYEWTPQFLNDEGTSATSEAMFTDIQLRSCSDHAD